MGHGEKTGRITAVLALSMLSASLGTSIANIALPTLAETFAASFAQVQAIVVSYLAALTVCVLIAGRLGDILGLKPMLLGGIGLFAVAAMLCAVAPNLWLLIGARAIQGVGAAFLMTLSMALMRDTSSEARVGRAMGLLGTVSALGTALGPSLGGVLISSIGWRSIFLVQAPLAALAFLLAVAVLPDGPGKKPSATRFRTLFDRSLIPNLLVNLLVAAVMMTTLLVGPFYLGRGLGLNEVAVGLLMSVGPMISILTGVPSGRLVDAWGASRVSAVGLILLASGSFLLAILPNWIGVAGYVVSIAVLTPGYQLFQAANNTAALANVPRDRRGTISGLLGLSRNIGLIAGASVMSGVFATGVGTADFIHASPSAIAEGMRFTFLAAGCLMFTAIGIRGRLPSP